MGAEGYQQDADSGLMLLGARYYDPSVGRFISSDPIRYGGGDANLYRYCLNLPQCAVDPSGTIPPLLVLAAVLAVGVILTADAGEVLPLDTYGPAVVETGYDFWNSVNNGLGLIFSIGGDYGTVTDSAGERQFVVYGGWVMDHLYVYDQGGLTLGDKGGPATAIDVIDHEVVHTQQERLLGPLFLPAYAAGAVIGGLRGVWHDGNSFEQDAERRKRRK